MKLINNIFEDIREIRGFTKDEMLEIKRTFTKFNAEKTAQTEIDDYLNTKFSSEILEIFSKYIRNIRDFIETYLTTKSESTINVNYYYLISGIFDELKLISKNLLNFKMNGRNIGRFLKNNAFLDGFLSTVQILLDESNDLISIIENLVKEPEGIFDNKGKFWIEVNKIKKLNFQINKLPETLKKWDEINELFDFIENANIDTTKKKKKKKGLILTSFFNDIYQFYKKKQGEQIDFYSNLIFLLFQNKIIEVFKGDIENLDDFVNILDEREIIQNLEKFLIPIVKTLIENKLRDVLDELEELDKTFKLEDDKKSINLKTLLEQKISLYLPKIVDYYLNGIEKKYQAKFGDLKEDEEFKNIRKSYSATVNHLYSLFEEIITYLLDFEPFIEPYDDIIGSYKKIIENVHSEITRRKDDYSYYLKTIKKERLRDNVRNFIYEKMSEVNDLMSNYQDETSIIVKEEFPQLKQIREILSKYKKNIQKIKDDVYKKLDYFKEKDINIYQIIKQWEDNFTLKRQQLSFLLSLMLKKLFKNFKELIEEEEILFESMAEITEQNDSVDSVPLNFALSNYLVDKLTEDELNERIGKVNLKIENLNKQIILYQSELSNLEKTMAEKVKKRTGISVDNIMCGVCHKQINLAKAQIIKCPFCDAVYHYLCVAFWISKYNSCPACQNTFLDPNAGMYEVQE